MNEARTIVWDIDDVLNDQMRSWFESAWLPEHRDCPVTYEEIRENPPHRILGITLEEYLASLDAFRASAAAAAMLPNAEVLKWLDCHGGRFRHIALTARPLTSAGSAAEWLFRHFGTYIRTFSVVPSRRGSAVPAGDRTKKEFLEWLEKADVLIDDNEENVSAARELGIHGVLFPQPWNGSSLTQAETLELLYPICRQNR